MRYLAFALWFFAAVSAAAESSYRFDGIRLVDFVRVVYTDVLQRSYIIDAELLAAPDTVTVDLRRVSDEAINDQVVRLLESRGYQLTADDYGVIYIQRRRPVEAVPKPKEVLSLFLYRPRHRPVRYLLDLSSQFFQPGAFLSQRKIAQQGITSGGEAVTESSPTSAFALIDKGADVIVFQGTQEEITRLQKLYAELDKPAGEVLVKAVVYEVRRDTSESNAVDLALGLLSSVKGIGVQITNGADSGNAFKVRFSNVAALWSALSNDGRFKLVSAPTIRVKSGMKARFMTGQEVPTLGEISYQGSSGTPVRSIVYRPSGVILSLTPEVREEGTIDLHIDQQISSFSKTTSGVNDSPTLLKRELQTAVTVEKDEMIILGGLDETAEEETDSGISFLPAFLRGTSSSTSKTEILMMLHVQRI